MWQSILITHSPLSVNWAPHRTLSLLLSSMNVYSTTTIFYYISCIVVYEYRPCTLNTIMFLLVCNIYYCLSSAVIILTLYSFVCRVIIIIIIIYECRVYINIFYYYLFLLQIQNVCSHNNIFNIYMCIISAFYYSSAY